MRISVVQSSLQWKKLCLRFMPSLMPFKTNWRNITTICRIWSSPYKMVNFGSCRLVTVSARVQQWLKLQWTCSRKVKLTRRQPFCAASQTSSTNSFTLYSTRKHWHKPECLHVVCLHLQVQQVDKSCSLPMMQQSGTKMDTRL